MEQNRLQQAKKGDSDAYFECFQKYQDDLYKLAFIHVKNSDDALDIIQEVAFKSYKHIHTLKDTKYFKTWLIRILINVVNDHFRKNQTYEEFIENDATSYDMPDIDVQITLKGLMNYLSTIEKQIIYLKYYEDYTFEQISQLTDLKLGSVKTVLYRALNKLRNQMEKEDEFDEIQRRA